jgi:hypothetical protein
MDMILVLQCMAPPLSTAHHQRDVSAFQMQSKMQCIEKRYTRLPPRAHIFKRSLGEHSGRVRQQRKHQRPRAMSITWTAKQRQPASLGPKGPGWDALSMLGVDEVGAVRGLDGVQRVGRAGSLTAGGCGCKWREKKRKTRVPCSTAQCQEAKEKV